MHFTNKDKLNSELGWETIMERGKILGLNMFQKIHLHETRPLIRKCMTKLDFEKKILTMSRGGYIPHYNYGKQFKMSFSLIFLVFGILCPQMFNLKTLKYLNFTQKKSLNQQYLNTFQGGVK